MKTVTISVRWMDPLVLANETMHCTCWLSYLKIYLSFTSAAIKITKFINKLERKKTPHPFGGFLCCLIDQFVITTSQRASLTIVCGMKYMQIWIVLQAVSLAAPVSHSKCIFLLEVNQSLYMYLRAVLINWLKHKYD